MINKILTAIFAMLIAVGCVSIVTGSASFYLTPMLAIHLCCALALNNKGGSLARGVAKVVGYLLATSLLAAIYFLLSPLFGERFEPKLIFSMLSMGIIGFMTVLALKGKRTSGT